LMLVSVSAQASVLSETWAQNLDLTIPSSEMPLTWELDLKDKHAIILGHECCYRQELLDWVKTTHTQELMISRLKEKKNESSFTLVEPISNAQWASFVGLQLADIYTTYKGLKYDCVRELNPVIGDRPSVQDMFFIKTVVLAPAIQYDLERKNLTPKVMNQMNLFMALVVSNNYNVWRRADKRCNKY